MTLPNKHQLALASAKSVVRSSRQAFQWMLAGIAAFNVATGCAESNGGSQNGDAAMVGDTGNYSDIINDLVDLVTGADTTESADSSQPPNDVAEQIDTTGTAPDTSVTQNDVVESPDQTEADTASSTDTMANGDDVVEVVDTSGTPDATTDPDVAAEDVQAADAGMEADTTEQPSCLQATGEPCAIATDCEADWALCEEGECMEQDFSNEIAMECCQEYYASGVFTPLPKGCNPWGPPAPPAFVAAAFKRNVGVA